MYQNHPVPPQLPNTLANIQKEFLIPENSQSAEALDRIDLRRRVIEDFQPICAGLEWRLSELAWHTKGTSLFTENEVPFAINNDGRHSERAARVLLANCLERKPIGEIRLLECGAGTGLFAKYFLDIFRDMCRESDYPFYSQVKFYVTDGSVRTVGHWQQWKIFAEHAERVELVVADSMNISNAVSGKFDAFFFNYILDSLPAAVIRKRESDVEELCVRTHLTEDEARLSKYTSRTFAQLRELASSPDPAAQEELISLVSLMEFETAFLPRSNCPLANEAITFATGLDRVVLNHGAIRCIESCLDHLSPGGFILFADYGAAQLEQVAGQAMTQRFGRTSALGLNFPFLEHHFNRLGSRVHKAPEDDERPIHTRLLTREASVQTVEAFREQFSGQQYRWSMQAQEEARRHIECGRFDQAMDAYKVALSRASKDWQLLGEIAEFIVRTLGDYRGAVDVGWIAVRLNPWYSAWLWNVLGDALFALERFSEALDCYREAVAIHPRDPRTRLNLAYCYAQAGEFERALPEIALGLAADGSGLFRDRLIEKQQQILGGISAKFQSEQEWLARRVQRYFASGNSPA